MGQLALGDPVSAFRPLYHPIVPEATTMPRSLQTLLLLSATVVLIAGLKAAGSILLPILVAIFLAIICTPPVSWLQRKGLPDWASVAVVFLAVFLAFLLLSGVILSSVSSVQADLGQTGDEGYQAKLLEKLTPTLAWLQGLGLDLTRESIREFFDSSRLTTYLSQGLGALTSILSSTFLILLTVMFVLAEAAIFPRKLRAMVGDPDADVSWSADVLDDLRTYLAVKTQCSLMVSVTVTIALWLIGVDFPVLWGLIAFLLNYIPTLGSIIAAIPPILLAYIQFDLGWAIAVAGCFLVANFAIGNILEPRMMGRRLGLSTLVVFLSMVFWGWVWGPIGMVLSVPLTMIIKILLEHTDDLQWVAILLGSSDDADLTQGEKQTDSVSGKA